MGEPKRDPDEVDASSLMCVILETMLVLRIQSTDLAPELVSLGGDAFIW